MRTVCIGDSFTKGFGVGPEENWVSLLDTPCSTFINKGINGDTTGGMLARFQKDAVETAPNYIMITGGVNDFIAGVDVSVPQANYLALAHHAYHYNMIPVMGIQPALDAETDAENELFQVVLEKQRIFRQWIKTFCQSFGIFYIDFYEALEQAKKENPAEQYYLDGTHLTASGHQHMVKAVLKTMEHF